MRPSSRRKRKNTGWSRGAKLGSAKTEAFMAPKVRDMNGWIVNETKQQGGKISSKAAAKLAELVGADTRQAAQEIAKVLTYVNWERQIDLADVQAVCVSTAEVNIFDLVDSLALGDGKTAQSMLRKMLEEKNAAEIFPMIIRQFRLLIQAREIVEGVRHGAGCAGSAGSASVRGGESIPAGGALHDAESRIHSPSPA